MKWFKWQTPVVRTRRLIISLIGHDHGGGNVPVVFEVIWQGKRKQHTLISIKVGNA